MSRPRRASGRLRAWQPPARGRPTPGFSRQAVPPSSLRLAQANYCIWPLFHLVNFRFVPVRMQVLATTAMSMVWNGVLSHVARPGQEHDDKG